MRLRQVQWGARIPISCEAPTLLTPAPAQLPFVVVSSLQMSVSHAAQLHWIEHTLNLLHEIKIANAETPCPSRNCCIAQQFKSVQRGSNPQASDLGSDALPLRHKPLRDIIQALSRARCARTALRHNLLHYCEFHMCSNSVIYLQRVCVCVCVRYCCVRLYHTVFSHLCVFLVHVLSSLVSIPYLSFSRSLSRLLRGCSVALPSQRCPCAALWLRALQPWVVADRHLGVCGHRLDKRSCARVRQ